MHAYVFIYINFFTFICFSSYVKFDVAARVIHLIDIHSRTPFTFDSDPLEVSGSIDTDPYEKECVGKRVVKMKFSFLFPHSEKGLK